MDNEEELFDVAISGISGRFPSCDNLEELKQNLLNKVNLVNDQNCRWNKEEWKYVPSATGKMSVLKKFDDVFFGIHSGVAGMMDPLTRVAIERAYEAIMDAGINPKHMRGRHVAVYTNSCISDSEAVGCDEKLTVKFWLLAHVRALLANRISYVLNLKGPSWTLDSTWVGGIECLRQAVHDIKVGQIEAALVGVSNVIVFPDLSQHWLGLGKLSPDGTCQPFQENANGYGRSDGVVFLFLQKANEANRIYATIPHVDATFCGDKANTFLQPKEEAFVDFFKKFYSDCPVPADDICYLEADGSADKFLDEIELNSIGEVICNRRKEKLLVGAVKSNLGHTEGSASLVSVAKTLICLDSGVIPPNLGFSNANKNIKKLQTNDMEIVTNAVPFPSGKLAAVNSIGLCTSVGHVLLKPNPKEKKLISDKHQQIPRLVLVSARHEPGILSMVDQLESMPYDAEYFAMVNNVFKESMTGHFYRGFTILGATEKKIHFTLETGTVSKRPVWFVFAGMGSQWPGMGADLMHLPIFANSMRELDTYLKPLGVDIINVISSFDPTVLKNVVNSFVGITAIQIGMVDVLKSVGIEADGMFGHSLGENGCAYADGCFTKYQTIMSAYYRGKASGEAELKKGLMASIGLGHDKMNNLPENVQIACHNSSDNTTISGVYEEVQAYMEEMKRQNIFTRAVNSNFIAYHSEQVRPIAPFVLENISKVVPNPKKRSSRWISTSVPEQYWNSPAAQYSSGEYHVNNFLGTVYFAEACTHIPEEAIVIEISPHGLFQSILKRSIPESCFCIPLGKREISSSLNFLLSSIGKMYVVGMQPEVNAIYPPVEFPVSRGTPSLATLATWNYDNNWEMNSFKDNTKIKPMEISLRDREWRFLTGYKIQDRILVPFPLFLMETLHAYETNDPILLFENVNIENFVEVTTNNCLTITTQVQYGSGNFEIVQDKKVIINGVLRYSQENLSAEESCSENDFNDCITFTRNEIQEIFKQHSMKFSQQFNQINEVIFLNDGFHASLVWDNNLAFFINTVAHVKMFYELCITQEGPILPNSFLRLAIEMEKYNTLQSGAILNITYDKNINIIKGPGFELTGLVNSYQSSTTNTNELVLQDRQFVPHDNPLTKSLEKFFNLCQQIIGETFYTEIDQDGHDKSPPINVILSKDLDKDEFQIELLLKMLHRELSQTQIDITIAEEKSFKNGVKNNNKYTRSFVICKNTENLVESLSQLSECVEDMFLLCFDGKSKIPPQFTKVTEETIEQQHVSLWKKKASWNENVIRIKPSNDSHWLEDLKEDFYGITAQKSVILQWRSDHVVDIVDVIDRIGAVRSVHAIRYLVIMDQNVPAYTKDSEFYQQQLEKGLTMNIFKNGKWGSIRHLSIAETLSTMPETHKLAIKTKKLENIDVEYTSLHGTTATAYSKLDDSVFEFSGTTLEKQKVMGIARTTKNCSGFSEILMTWPVPEQWSLEEAVTVPLAYATAYYALVIDRTPSGGSSILVNSGHTILGEACIAVALSWDYDVYTSTDTAKQAQYIRERFNNSGHLRVFVNESAQVDVEVLKSTKGQGVDIIVNADNEQQIIQTINCLKTYGSFIQVAESNKDTKMKLGMEIFLKNTVLRSLTNLLPLQNQPKFKNQVQNLLQEALQCGKIVKPFNRIVYKANDESSIIKALQENSKSRSIVIRQISNLNTKNELFLCDPEKSYLVIGNKTEIWFSVITWLLEHNVKKLVLIEECSENYYNQYQKRFNLFVQNYPSVSLMYLPSSTLNSKEEAADMINTVNGVVPLDVAFCISLDGDRIRNVNAGIVQCAPSLRQLVCLQCDGAKVCESRHHLSLPILNVIWDSSISEVDVLIRSIKQIVNNCLRINSPLIYIADSAQFTSNFDGSKLGKIREFLPQYAEHDAVIESFSTIPKFEKITTKCPEYNTRTQLFPIFVIPGLHSKRLQPLIKNLMYPVFCAKMSPKYSSARDIAQSLIKSLKEIRPSGPYTIMGETWSGAVAMELTSLLEQNHQDRVQLILIEGIPKDMKDKLSMLGTFGGHEFLDNLCELCYGKKLSKTSLMEDGKFKIDNDQMKFLELLQRKLSSIYHYSPSYVNINGKVIAIKSTDEHVLNTYINFEKHYGENLDLKIIENENYNDLVKSKAIETVINDSVLFQW